VPEHFAVALGPYRLKVIVPVGAEPPDKVAMSVTVALPAGPPPLGLVVMVGAASGGVIVTDSVPQPEAAELLALSPP
jgi:hypothetical protein